MKFFYLVGVVLAAIAANVLVFGLWMLTQRATEAGLGLVKRLSSRLTDEQLKADTLAGRGRSVNPVTATLVSVFIVQPLVLAGLFYLWWRLTG